MLDDMPGMDIARGRGDSQFKNYWRGYRIGSGDAFVVMVDGIVFNALFNNQIDNTLVSYPMSNIDRVEIVYGPASAIYGSNAFMGVINIITRRDVDQNGVTQTATLTYGTNEKRVADATLFFKKDDLRFIATGRVDHGNWDSSHFGMYEYTKMEHLSNSTYWGKALENTDLTEASSKNRNYYVDARAYWKSSEAVVSLGQTNSGTGTIYPFPTYHPHMPWVRQELSGYLRQNFDLGEYVTSSTTLRFRRSDITNDSYDFLGTNSTGYKIRLRNYMALASSQSMFQDFDIHPTNWLSIVTGVKYERKSLPKGYDRNSSSTTDPALWNPDGTLGSGTQPTLVQDTERFTNRYYAEDRALYVQAKIKPLDGHTFLAGARHDRNSVYGPANTLRGGYVATFAGFSGKILYGQGYNEPTARQVYGGWAGTGPSLNVKPERSSTLELSLSHATKNIGNGLSIWNVKNTDTIIGSSTTTTNLGERRVLGADYTLQGLVSNIGPIGNIRFWGSYSRLFSANEDTYNAARVKTGEVFIGDLAKDKVLFGATNSLPFGMDWTLRGRAIGKRQTVSTNPLGYIGGYFVLDATAEYKYKNATVSLSVTNLLNREYAHPGNREATMGNTPATVTASGYTGTIAGYNSMLPQPGREYFASLRFDI